MDASLSSSSSSASIVSFATGMWRMCWLEDFCSKQQAQQLELLAALSTSASSLHTYTHTYIHIFVQEPVFQDSLAKLVPFWISMQRKMTEAPVKSLPTFSWTTGWMPFLHCHPTNSVEALNKEKTSLFCIITAVARWCPHWLFFCIHTARRCTCISLTAVR